MGSNRSSLHLRLLGAVRAAAMAGASFFLFFFFCCCFFFFCSCASPSLPAAAAAAASSSQLLSSPQFFLSNHARMLSSFKVFIYPQPWLLPPPDDAPLLFHSLLSRSSFVTEDPESAHLYFIPPHPPSPSPSPSSSASSSSPYRRKSARDVVQELRDAYPFWQRTLGRDHFYAVCPRVPADGSRNVLELQKNAIAMACSELFADDDGSTQTGHKAAAAAAAAAAEEEGLDPQFFPHKDIVLPPFHSLKMQSKDAAAAAAMARPPPPPSPRPFLVYVMDSKSTVARKLWCDDSEFLFHPREGSASGTDPCASQADRATASDAIARSKFCLTFASQGVMKRRTKGNSSSSIDLVDAMAAGCVPVIIAHGYLHSLPFQDLLDWAKFSVIRSSEGESLGKLKAELRAMAGATRYRELQSSAIAASRTHLQWHVPPEPLDAFYMVMHQLWLRRHSVRYVQRGTASV